MTFFLSGQALESLAQPRTSSRPQFFSFLPSLPLLSSQSSLSSLASLAGKALRRRPPTLPFGIYQSTTPCAHPFIPRERFCLGGVPISPFFGDGRALHRPHRKPCSRLRHWPTAPQLQRALLVSSPSFSQLPALCNLTSPRLAHLFLFSVPI